MIKILEMEETLRENELKNVYSYCELDDPKYSNNFQNIYGNFQKDLFRREFNELDLNQKLRDAEMSYNAFMEEKKFRKTSRSQERPI